MAQPTETRDVPLSPGVFAHIQDMNRGAILTFVGPCKINGNDLYRPVVYNAGDHTFVQSDAQHSQRRVVHVKEGQYAVLHNPALADDGKVNYPRPGVQAAQDQPTLSAGQSMNIPGPIDFALWPEQSAQVIDGHILCSNQYLLVRIIDAAKAKKNWASAVIQAAEGAETAVDEIDFTTGALNVIKGTACKFFIPCTGVEVLSEVSGGSYVRDAVSLETLEYCILLDESGAKRYERGTAEGNVVFPRPTESFWVNEKNDKVFRAYELTKISGVFVKVIADYTDKETNVAHKAGEELFITGDGILYFPRPEHAIIKYGAHARHYATAIPPGAGRYVMDRTTGEFVTMIGPAMVLLHPSQQVFVRRILPLHLCLLYWPGDDRKYQHQAQLQAKATTAKLGYAESTEALTSSFSNMGGERSVYATRAQRTPAQMSQMTSAMADEVRRGTTYTPPRILTLDSDLEEALSVDVPSGCAVSVVNKRGGRKTVMGSNTVILEYDETLEVLHLSTGKPKNTDALVPCVYLQVLNNKVSDIVAVTTADHVDVQVKLSYRVNFEGDNALWFKVDNYVKLLCDHIRSILKGEVRKLSVKDFYADPTGAIRDFILGVKTEGAPRTGMVFSENGMKVIDVDVLNVVITESKIAQELVHAQYDALTKALSLENKTREIALEKALMALTQEQLTAQAEVETLQAKLALQRLNWQLEQDTKAAAAKQALEMERQKLVTLEEEIADLEHARELARDQADAQQELATETANQQLRLETIDKETGAIVARFNASGPALASFAATMADGQVREAFIKGVVALDPISGGDLVKTVNKVAPGLGGHVGAALRQLVGATSSTED